MKEVIQEVKRYVPLILILIIIFVTGAVVVCLETGVFGVTGK